MPEPALIDADCEAEGHPTECQEPAPGTVVQTTANNITVTVGGTTKQVATLADADMDFPSHAHDYSSSEGCHQNGSHTIDPDEGEPSITINGSPIYLVEPAVTTDPTTGGDVNITTNPVSSEINKT